MKNLLLFTSFLLILFGCAKSDPAAEKANAEAAVKGFYNAATKFDYAAMRTFCTEDFNGIENGHIYKNLDEFLEMTKFLEGSKGQINMDFMQTNIAGDVAFLVIKFDAVWTKEPNKWFLKTIENYILKKVNGKWLIYFWQSSYLADEHDKQYTTIHLMKIPEKVSITELNEIVLKINSTIAALGYPECGYKLLKVIPEKDSRYSWVLEGKWKSPDVYKIIHENKEVSDFYQQNSKQFSSYFNDEIYLKAVLPE
jgi:hypothetical protein